MRSSYSVVGEFTTMFDIVLKVHIDHVSIDLKARSIIPLRSGKSSTDIMLHKSKPACWGILGASYLNSVDHVILIKLPNGFRFTVVESHPTVRALCGGQSWRRINTKFKVFYYFQIKVASENWQRYKAINENMGEVGHITLPVSEPHVFDSSKKLFSRMGLCCMGTCDLRIAGINSKTVKMAPLTVCGLKNIFVSEEFKWTLCEFESDSGRVFNTVIDGKNYPNWAITNTVADLYLVARDFVLWKFKKFSRKSFIFARKLLMYRIEISSLAVVVVLARSCGICCKLFMYVL